MKLLLLMTLAVVCNLAAADLPTKWTGVMSMPSGPAANVFLTLRQQDQEISGTLAYQYEMPQIPLEKPELHGNQLTFEIHDNPNRVVAFRLTLGENFLTGEARSADRVAEVKLLPAGRSGVFRVGGGISAPVLLYKIEPDYTPEARSAKYQGTVLLYVQVDRAGRATNIRVLHGLGLGLDEKAIDCVKQWRFKPGMKGDEPVTVEAQIEVNFRLP